MYATLASLIDRLDSSALSKARVVRKWSPVPTFGDLSSAQVATVGINPSNLEFVDDAGNELQGKARRFHTLRSLGIESWADVDARHLRLMLESFDAYFHRNPYDRWFKRLDFLLAGVNASYYDSLLRANELEFRACHLDLVPYATACKWTELSGRERAALLELAGDTLGSLVRDSPVRLVILNGQSVVRHFEYLAGAALERHEVAVLDLPRRKKPNVVGVAYTGVLEDFGGVALGHRVAVFGFNHNIQSSFGVTGGVIRAMRDWLGKALVERTP